MLRRMFFCLMVCTLVFAGHALAVTSSIKIVQAIEANNMELLKRVLVASGIEINSRLNGKTPLHIAAELGNFPAVSLLIANGADAMLDDSAGSRPFAYAAVLGKENPQHAAVAAMLLQAEFVAGGDAMDENLWSSIHWAVWSRDRDLMQQLIDEGESIWNSSGAHSPVKLAMSMQQEGLAEFLIKTDGKINSVFTNGRTPLSIAAENGELEFLQLLLKCGAKINAVDMEAAAAGGHLAIVAELIKHGADVNSRSANVRRITPLHIAAIWGNKEVVELLLEKGANVNAVGKANQTALMQVIERGNMEESLAIIELLLQYETNINITDVNDNNALMTAAKRGFLPVMQILLDAGANVHAKNKHGQNAATLAAMAYNVKAVKLLRRYGASMDGIDSILASSSYALYKKTAIKRVLQEAGG